MQFNEVNCEHYGFVQMSCFFFLVVIILIVSSPTLLNILFHFWGDVSGI